MIGKTISHYEILDKLGEGGMGVVYKALDTTLDRHVAIKFLPHHLQAIPDAKTRFVHEAKAASALEHPNICAVHEIDETPDHQMYMVMPSYDGQSLQDRIQDPVSVDEALDFVEQIASGLAKAHARGIVHRDIKPGNIFVTEDGHIKILDFGLAKLAGQTKITKTGMTVGTASYMSPEQARGEEIDSSTDVFSLGVVLYQLLTGHLPFIAEHEAALLYKIMNEDPAPLATHRDDLVEGFQRVVDKALAKDHEMRCRDAAELLEDLQRVRGGKEVAVVRRLSRKALRRALRNRMIWLGTIAVVMAGLLLVLSQLRPGSTDFDYQKAIAVLPFDNLPDAGGDDYFSDGITEDIISTLSKVGALRVIARSSVMRYKASDKTLSEIANELNVRTVLTGSIRRSGEKVRIVANLVEAKTGTQIWSERYDRELKDIFAIQADVAEKIASSLEAELSPLERELIEQAPTQDLRAYDLYLKGRFQWNQRTQTALLHAIDFFDQAIETDSSYALAYSGLADSYYLLVDYGYASPHAGYPKAIQAAKRAIELDERLAEAHTSLAWSKWSYEWDLVQAEVHFRQAISVRPNYATSRQWFGEYLMATGRIDEAVEQVERARSIDPLSPIINTVLAWCYQAAGQYGKAENQYHATLDNEPDFVPAQYLLGLFYLETSRYDDAIETYEALIETDPESVSFRTGLASAYAATGRIEEATRILNDLENKRRTDNIPAYYIAALYAGLSDKDRAFEWLEKSYDDRESHLVTIRLDPKLNALRSDPRYAVLLEKIGLP